MPLPRDVDYIQATAEACRAFFEKHGRPVTDPMAELDYWAIQRRAEVVANMPEQLVKKPS